MPFLEFHGLQINEQGQLKRMKEQPYLTLDSQSIEHLELIAPNGLFTFINHCKTPFGKRLLKKWLLQPLTEINRINERLDSVEDLMMHHHDVQRLVQKLSKLPDLERIMSKVFTYSVRAQVKAIYFENVSF